MAKIKKVSINAFDRVKNEVYTPTEAVEWNGLEITIKKTLSLKEMMSFVDGVTKSCFAQDNNTYLPEIKDFAIKCSVLEMYANFAMPSNVEHRYELVYSTDAYETVIRYINQEQFIEIINAIDKRVDNIAKSNIEAINKQMVELYSALDSIQRQFSDIFAGVGSEELFKLVGAISDGKIDEEKLVRAYVEQKNENGEE